MPPKKVTDTTPSADELRGSAYEAASSIRPLQPRSQRVVDAQASEAQDAEMGSSLARTAHEAAGRHEYSSSQDSANRLADKRQAMGEAVGPYDSQLRYIAGLDELPAPAEPRSNPLRPGQRGRDRFRRRDDG